MELSELATEFILALDGANLLIWEKEEKQINNDITFRIRSLLKKNSVFEKIIINPILIENYNFLLGNINYKSTYIID